MTQNDQIVSTLEESLKVLEAALNEKEHELRTLLYAFKVSSLEDIDEIESYKIGAELDSQIDTLKNLIDDVKWHLRYISAFKNV